VLLASRHRQIVGRNRVDLKRPCRKSVSIWRACRS